VSRYTCVADQSRTYDQATASNRVLRSYLWESTTGRLLSMTANQAATVIQALLTVMWVRLRPERVGV
jgi:hypothetical protein